MPSAVKLPPLTVARFEQAVLLLERIADEQTDVFLARMHGYRAKHRESTSRPLDPQEAAQVAAAMAQALDSADDPAGAAARMQQSGLRAYDEPAPREVLVAAGVATAPAFLRVVLRLVTLLELPADTFEEACEAEQLDAAIEDALNEPEQGLLRADLDVARERATAALEHLAAKTGQPVGEAWRLLTRTVWQALNEAAQQMTVSLNGSRSSSLTGSHAPTNGTGETSSTEPLSRTP